MKFSEINQKIKSVINEYRELHDSELIQSKKVIDVCYLKIRDIMLSTMFLHFLMSNFDFAVFPSYDDEYCYDIQIVCC